LLLNKKYFNLEGKLGKYYKIQIENEKRHCLEASELKVKEFIIEKELKIQILNQENSQLKEKVSDFTNSYISLNDHEFILRNIKKVLI
jgi:hypothetical protein